jgi:hypothetical protein
MSFAKWRITMKTRHIAATLMAATLLAWALVSCNLNPVVSIDQRVSNFASDLSNNRTNAYQNFDPDQTKLYQALANPTYSWNTLFPPSQYTFQITDESSPSTGVLVTVASPGGFATPYLKLVMATYKDTDWRIVQLFLAGTPGGFTVASIY